MSIVGGRGERAAAVGGRVHQAEERGDLDVAPLDRQEQPAPRDVLVGGVDEAVRSGVRLRQSRRLRAERGVAADLLAGRLRVPEEVAGRVDADHHRAVDALRVAPGVDHRRARAGALADEVDSARSRARGGRARDRRRARAASSRRGRRRRSGAGWRTPGTRPRRTRTTRSLRRSRECSRRGDLGAVEPCRAVDAAVADEHDVVVGREAARVREVHVRDAGAALEAEDRCAGMRRARVDPGHRKRDQARVAGRAGSRGTTSVPQSARLVRRVVQ